MNGQVERVSWAEAAMYGVAGVAGVGLGVLAAIWLGNAAAAESSFFWFVTRASAIVGYLLLWLSTATGITLSSKGLGGRVSGPPAYALHNVTSWLALGFSAVHAVSLLGEASVPFTVPAILIPFVSTYEPLLVAAGILSLYAGVIVTGSFYLRKRLELKAWRTIHGLSYLMFAAVTVHSILLGSDTGTLVMQAIYGVAGASVALLTMFRVMTAKSGKRSGMRTGKEVVTA